MKTAKNLFVLGLLMLSLLNCKKSEIDPPDTADTNCKLTALDFGDGNKEEYEYDAAGFLKKFTTRVPDTGGKVESVYGYTFTYDKANQLTGAAITVNGKTPTEVTNLGLGNRITCSWTNGKLTEMTDMLGNEALYITTINYDAQGRIVRLFCLPANTSEYPFEKTYTYDADGNYKFQLLENDKLVSYDELIVDRDTKSAESLLVRRGLPFHPVSLYPWKANILKSFKSFRVDSTGKATLSKSYQITNVIKNSHSYALSQTVEEGGKKRVQTFTLADCE